MTKVTKIGFASFAAVAALTFTRASDAGESSGNGGAYCWVSGGSGSCEGTLEGFRTASDSNAYAYFTTWDTGGYFGGSLNGQSGGCSMQASQMSEFQAIQSAPPQTYFYVQWSSNGQCNFIELGAFSDYY
jgi:hypothetical protein